MAASEELRTAGIPASVRVEGAWKLREARWWRYALLRRLLACADVAAALLACLSLVFPRGDPGSLAWGLVFLPLWVVVAKLLGLYDADERALRHLTVDEGPRLMLMALLGAGLLSLLLGFTPAGRPDASRAVAAGLVVAASVFPLRAIARLVWRLMTPPERVAIIGSPESAAAIKRKVELFPDVHMEIVEAHSSLEADPVDPPGWLGTIDRLVFAPRSLDRGRLMAILSLSRTAGIALTVVPPCYEAFGSAVRLNYLAELPLLEFKTSDLSRSTLFLKRAFDIVFGSVLLVMFLPVLAILAVAIKLDSPGPIFFVQLRAGVGGRPFRMLKLRSMVADAEEQLPGLVRVDRLEEPVFKLHGDPRVTRVGRVIRRWSLDELPQLWNILLGHMSWVGPRPEEVALVERYTSQQRIRLAIKPGLTGPMQVYGRGALTLEERLAVERDYIENLSLGRDLRILGMTFSAVLRGEGAF